MKREYDMSEKILVTYASRAGSTAEVAQVIGAVLMESFAQVDVVPMQDVKDLSLYRAVVVGSAVRGSKWLPEAMQFVQSNHSELIQKPSAMFTVCITMAMRNAQKYRPGVAEWVAPVRTLVKPLSEEFFAGMLDFSKLPVNMDTQMLRLSVALGIFPRGDHRDWKAIRAWAGTLKPLFGV